LTVLMQSGSGRRPKEAANVIRSESDFAGDFANG